MEMSVPVIQHDVHHELTCRWLPRSSESPRRSARIELLEGQLERLLKRANIAVIHGGDKSESGAVINPTQNTRAWKSYREVALDIVQALRGLGAQNVSIMPEDMRLAQRLRDDGIDIA
jgi:D-alanine-D-alanine ligase